MMEAVNQDIADVASSTTGVDRRQFRALTKIKKAIRNSVEDSGNDALVKEFGEFNRYYAQEYSPRFLRGENIKQTLKNELGVEVVPDEKVLGSYLKPGASAPMRRFTQLYGQKAEAMRLMEGAIYDRYAKEAITSDGIVDPVKHNRFMFNYGAQIRQVDKFGANIGKTLAKRNTSTQEVVANKAALENQLAKVNNDAFVNALQDKFGALPIDDVMAQATKDPRLLAKLASRMTGLEAKGMVNWFAQDLDTVISGAGYGKLGDAVNARLSDKNYNAAYRTAMEFAYGKGEARQHLERLNAIIKLASRIDATEIDPFSGLKGAGSADVDYLSKTAGFTARSVFNLARAMVAGRNAPEDVAFVLGTQFGAHRLQKMYNEITREILTNPQLSNEVLTAMRAHQAKGSSVDAWTTAGWKMTKAASKATWNYLGDVIEQSGSAIPAVAGAMSQYATQKAEERAINGRPDRTD